MTETKTNTVMEMGVASGGNIMPPPQSTPRRLNARGRQGDTSSLTPTLGTDFNAEDGRGESNGPQMRERTQERANKLPRIQKKLQKRAAKQARKAQNLAARADHLRQQELQSVCASSALARKKGELRQAEATRAPLVPAQWSAQWYSNLLDVYMEMEKLVFVEGLRRGMRSKKEQAAKFQAHLRHLGSMAECFLMVAWSKGVSADRLPGRIRDRVAKDIYRTFVDTTDAGNHPYLTPFKQICSNQLALATEGFERQTGEEIARRQATQSQAFTEANSASARSDVTRAPPLLLSVATPAPKPEHVSAMLTSADLLFDPTASAAMRPPWGVNGRGEPFCGVHQVKLEHGHCPECEYERHRETTLCNAFDLLRQGLERETSHVRTAFCVLHMVQCQAGICPQCTVQSTTLPSGCVKHNAIVSNGSCEQCASVQTVRQLLGEHALAGAIPLAPLSGAHGPIRHALAGAIPLAPLSGAHGPIRTLPDISPPSRSVVTTAPKLDCISAPLTSADHPFPRANGQTTQFCSVHQAMLKHGRCFECAWDRYHVSSLLPTCARHNPILVDGSCEECGLSHTVRQPLGEQTSTGAIPRTPFSCTPTSGAQAMNGLLTDMTPLLTHSPSVRAKGRLVAVASKRPVAVVSPFRWIPPRHFQVHPTAVRP